MTETKCAVCGFSSDLILWNGRRICLDCWESQEECGGKVPAILYQKLEDHIMMETWDKPRYDASWTTTWCWGWL